MARKVSYDRQTVGSFNPAKRLVHRSRIRRAVELAQQRMPLNGAVLDFGAGPGKFLNDLKLRRPDGSYFGYDKFKGPTAPGLNYVQSMSDIPDQSIDVLTAFEVLEHVIDQDLASFLREARRTLSKRGTLIVSVPIMFGPMVVVKDVSRMISRRCRSEYSAGELADVILGRRISRPEAVERYQTHKGFDFRELRARISQEFSIEREILSPFPALSWPWNSQVFFLAKHRS